MQTKNTIQCLLLVLLIVASCKKSNQGSGSIVLTPDSGPAGNLVTITGVGFDPDITQDSVVFNGLPGHIASVSGSEMQVLVPAGVTTGSVMVFVDGKQISGPIYTVTAISISGLSPTEGMTGDSVTITGLGLSHSGNLGNLAGLPTIRFNGHTATVVSATPTKVVALVPNLSETGPVTLSVGGDSATGPVFNYLGIDTMHPATGNAGTIVALTGGFGTAPAQDTVTFNGVKAVIDSVSPTRLVVTVPAGANTGVVIVRTAGRLVQGPVFTFVPAPAISGIAPVSGPAGVPITIKGTGFSTVPGENVVTFNGVPGTLVSASATQLVVNAPVGVTSGPVLATVNNQAAKGPVFTAQALGISAISSVIFVPPFVDTLRGTGFSATAAQNTVQFNGTTVTVLNATDTELVVQVPAGVTSGQTSIKVGALSAAGPAFSTAAVATLAGGGTNAAVGLADGQGAQAQFMQPDGLAVDASGNVFVADGGANNIREITPAGVVTNFAGDPNGGAGYTDAQGASAQFSNPLDITIDKNGNLYVADNGNLMVRKITQNGTVSTLIPALPSGDAPGGIALDASGNIYVTDNGSVYNGQTGAGNVYEYNASGTLLNTFPNPNATQLTSVAVDASGNIYTSDFQSGNVYAGTTTIAQIYTEGYYNIGLVVDNSGRLIATGATGEQIYRYDPANHFKATTLVGGAGVKGNYGYLDGPLQTALFTKINGVKIDAFGVLYITEGDEYDLGSVRKISLQ